MGGVKRHTYTEAGVQLQRAERLTEDFKRLLPQTFRKGCVPLPGGFAGLFDLKREGLEDALLVMSSDGVGTKIKLAIEHEKYAGLGVDLVAMNVNDVITVGAEPLCFLDYVAFSSLPNEVLDSLVAGMVDGCRQSGCALVGGETAQMPDMYVAGEFDLAGFCLGAVPRQRLVDGSAIRAGDAVVALPSHGIHSNGYTLVRAIVKTCSSAEVATYSEALLRPTRIYAPVVTKVCRQLAIRGMAHITGGGIAGNISRIIPDTLEAQIRFGSWQVPELFAWLQKQGNVDLQEMLRVFNMGVGFVFVCDPADEQRLLELLDGEGVVIGSVVDATKGSKEPRARILL